MEIKYKGEMIMGFKKNRVQAFNGRTGRWVLINTNVGRIISQKATDGPYKGVRKK